MAADASRRQGAGEYRALKNRRRESYQPDGMARQQRTMVQAGLRFKRMGSSGVKGMDVEVRIVRMHGFVSSLQPDKESSAFHSWRGYPPFFSN